MTKNLKQAFSKENLLRSWAWLNTSNGVDYKNYFRNQYKAYGLSLEENLRDLKHRLDKGIYAPSHSIKLYLPKKSGVLRPYTLLSIEDQIVYQALISVIAEKFKPFTPKGGIDISFSHKYTNANHTFFYKQWINGYKQFNKRVVKAFDDGFNISASFDLAAFYDSIDHKVLTYLLDRLKIEKEFAEMICSCLETWSSTDAKRIYHGHGIPQGPLSSGLLAELLLDNFDKLTDAEPLVAVVRYSRYVDDIRLMAKDEYQLRKSLICLDYASKNMGVFPQSSKIDIHKVEDVFEEIKTISLGPHESFLFGKKGGALVTQKEILAGIDKLIFGKKIKDETTLKYNLGFANANVRLSNKLLKILPSNPHLFISLLNYISKSPKLAESTSDLMFENASTLDVYEEITARYIKIAMVSIHPNVKASFDDLCEKLFKNIKNISSTELRSIVIAWRLNENKIKYSQLEKLLNYEEPRVTQALLEYIDQDAYGIPSYERLINLVLCQSDTETALRAAYLCIAENLAVTVPVKNINYLAQVPLKALGKIGKKTGRISSIGGSMTIVTERTSYASDWKKLFQSLHTDAEQQLFICRAYVQNDATAFINSLDVFHDILLAALFINDPALGTHILGITNIGSTLKGPSKALRAKFPLLLVACQAVHKLRYKSRLSHAKIGKTPKPTTNITFSEIKKIKPLLHSAYIEVTAIL